MHQCLVLVLGLTTTLATAADLPKPGEGVLCMAAITTVAREVGRRCYPNENPELLAELNRSVDNFDSYMLANGVSASDLKKFKEQQAGINSPTDAMCSGDTVVLYKGFTKPGMIAELKKGVAELTRRPGRPEWGDCL